MAMTSRVTLRVESDLTSALDLATPLAPLDYLMRVDLISGTGAGAADMQWSDRRTLAASASEDLDLAGSLTGPLGGTLTFARVKVVLVKALATNTNDVVVSRAAAGIPMFSATGDAIALPPGGWFNFGVPTAAGRAVTATTADTITVANSAGGTEVVYDIVVLGASA